MDLGDITNWLQGIVAGMIGNNPSAFGVPPAVGSAIKTGLGMSAQGQAYLNASNPLAGLIPQSCPNGTVLGKLAVNIGFGAIVLLGIASLVFSTDAGRTVISTAAKAAS